MIVSGLKNAGGRRQEDLQNTTSFFVDLDLDFRNWFWVQFLGFLILIGLWFGGKWVKMKIEEDDGMKKNEEEELKHSSKNEVEISEWRDRREEEGFLLFYKKLF